MHSKIFFLIFIIAVSLFFVGDKYIVPYVNNIISVDTTPEDISPLSLEDIKELPFVNINNAKIEVEIADTIPKRTKGLSGRDSLGENKGMLFVYPASGRYGFWMKDMKFPIDIIWIDKSYTIVDITKNLTPESYPDIWRPSSPSQYVLEVNAGFSVRNNITIGDSVEFNRGSGTP